jgi:hypothetical protein
MLLEILEEALPLELTDIFIDVVCCRPPLALEKK